MDLIELLKRPEGKTLEFKRGGEAADDGEAVGSRWVPVRSRMRKCFGAPHPDFHLHS